MKVYFDFSNNRYLTVVLVAIVLDNKESESVKSADKFSFSFDNENVTYNSEIKKSVKWSIHPQCQVYATEPMNIQTVVFPEEITCWAKLDECTNYSEILDEINRNKEKVFPISFSELDTSQTHIISFPKSAFYHLSYKNIILPNIKAVSHYMFSNCAFTEITLPESVSEIYPYAFYKSKIEKINGLGPNIHKIHDRAFYGVKINKIDLSKTSIFDISSNTLANLTDNKETKIVLPYYIDFDTTE